LRTLLFGLGAAIVGAIIYFAVLKITGLELSLITILIGFMVGTAVMKGSQSRGGRRYQVIAVVLTYLAIGLAFGSAAVSEGPLPGLIGALLLVLALPVMVVVGSMPGGLLSALIMGFGLLQAWTIPRHVPLEISGPYKVGTPPPSPAASPEPAT
jgi:hypothetical protein